MTKISLLTEFQKKNVSFATVLVFLDWARLPTTGNKEVKWFNDGAGFYVSESLPLLGVMLLAASLQA